MEPTGRRHPIILPAKEDLFPFCRFPTSVALLELMAPPLSCWKFTYKKGNEGYITEEKIHSRTISGTNKASATDHTAAQAEHITQGITPIHINFHTLISRWEAQGLQDEDLVYHIGDDVQILLICPKNNSVQNLIGTDKQVEC
jgi:hypothetical protein